MECCFTLLEPLHCNDLWAIRFAVETAASAGPDAPTAPATSARACCTAVYRDSPQTPATFRCRSTSHQSISIAATICRFALPSKPELPQRPIHPARARTFPASTTSPYLSRSPAASSRPIPSPSKPQRRLHPFYPPRERVHANVPTPRPPHLTPHLLPHPLPFAHGNRPKRAAFYPFASALNEELPRVPFYPLRHCRVRPGASSPPPPNLPPHPPP